LATPVAEAPPAEKKPRQSRTIPAAGSKEGHPSAVELTAVHSHVLGSCRGVLKFTREGVSFLSEKGKDTFYLKYPEYTWAMDNDQLTIKSGSRAFRFKPVAEGFGAFEK
jgi:hypothetical protein